MAIGYESIEDWILEQQEVHEEHAPEEPQDESSDEDEDEDDDEQEEVRYLVSQYFISIHFIVIATPGALPLPISNVCMGTELGYYCCRWYRVCFRRGG